MKKFVLLAFVLVLLSTAVVVGFVRPVADSLPVHNIDSGKVIAQTDSTTMVYLDPPTINGTEIGVGNTVTVNINISDAVDIYSWQAGLKFNATLLECFDFKEGEFLKAVGPTLWVPATTNNTAGVIDAHGCSLAGDYKTSGSGRLAYLTFKVKAPGVSDLHLRDVMVVDYDINEVPINIIDIYTVLVDTTDYTVVTVSNSTGYAVEWNEELRDWVYYHSGFDDHAFNASAEEISFKVTGPYPGFSNVTIPKALLKPEPLYGWGVIIDGSPLVGDERIITENDTHTSIYFRYSKGDHNVQITTRFIPSTISMTLSETSVTLGSTITISGGITPVRPFVNVTIEYRSSGTVTWTTIATVTTNSNGNYSYTWTPETAGTYEVKARWEGDENTLGDESEMKIVTVEPRTWIVDDDGPADFHTIQGAIDANETLDGHTILVYAGTYYENVVVNKSISLIGENKVTTTIDGNMTGTVVAVTADNVIISGFTIQNGGDRYAGISLSSNGNNVTNDIMWNNWCGISLEHYSAYNVIADNSIMNNLNGISGELWSDTTIIGNTLKDNLLGIWIGPYSSRNTIAFNNLRNHWSEGISMWQSSHNIIVGNNIIDNNQGGYWSGIVVGFSSYNQFFHNNIVNQGEQIDVQGEVVNTWDDGYPSGGNYWSNYAVDFYSGSGQNVTGSDGIGDAPYNINVHNQDRYPLMGPISFFNAGTWNETTYYIHTISNSTVSGFYFGEDDKLISFNVSGPDDTIGFCRVAIPNELLWCDNPEQWEVWVNNTLIEDRKIMEDTNYTYIYFTYNHSTQEVQIKDIDVIPEFPTWTSMLLILIVLTVATAIYKRRLLKTPIQ